MTCVKCGTVLPSTALFVRRYDGEWLVYACPCCGYAARRRPNDHDADGRTVFERIQDSIDRVLGIVK